MGKPQSLLLLLGCLVLGSFFFACETIEEAKGVVVGSDEQPLPGVEVRMRVDGDTHMTAITDSTGTFRVFSGLVPCSCGCPDIEVSFRKEGFIDQNLAPAKEMRVHLERSEATTAPAFGRGRP